MRDVKTRHVKTHCTAHGERVKTRKQTTHNSIDGNLMFVGAEMYKLCLLIEIFVICANVNG